MTNPHPPASVGIIGCGWLGTALAMALLDKNIAVLATSSQRDNVNKLKAKHIKAQQLSLPASSEQLVQHDIFKQSHLVIAIPPQFKRGRIDYGEKIKSLVTAAQLQGNVQGIILVSSSGIYNGLSGTVDESTALNLATEKAQILHQAEQAVLAFNGQASVLRLAGLVGPARHPGKFLAAKKTLSASNEKINLIHQQDAVGLIIKLLDDKAPQGIFNGVSENHVSKKRYYQYAARSLGLAPPTFTAVEHNQAVEPARIVCGEKAKRLLKYSFIYPDLLAWL